MELEPFGIELAFWHGGQVKEVDWMEKAERQLKVTEQDRLVCVLCYACRYKASKEHVWLSSKEFVADGLEEIEGEVEALKVELAEDEVEYVGAVLHIVLPETLAQAQAKEAD